MNGLGISERTVSRRDCPSCGSSFEHVTGFLHDAQGAVAPYYAACHRHPEPEVLIDVVLGTWGRDETADHLAISCRLRRSGAMVVDATVAVDSDEPIIGRKLAREAALAHPWLERFWSIVDYLAVEEPTIRAHLDAGGAAAHAD